MRKPTPLGPRPELHLRLAVRVRRLAEVGPHEWVRAMVHRPHQRDESSEPKPEGAPSEEEPEGPGDEGRRLADPGDGCGEIDEVCRRSREKRAVGDEQKVLGAVGGAAGHSHDFDRHSPRVTVEIVSHLERIRETHPGVIFARTREQSLGEESFCPLRSQTSKVAGTHPWCLGWASRLAGCAGDGRGCSLRR